MAEASEIVKFFTDKTVFLTGGTGFLGQLTLERLLRVCNVGLVYLLVRQKKQKSEDDRFSELFNNDIYDRLKAERPEFKKHLRMIIGDCGSVNLGVCESDWKLLHDQVDVVIHCAATVRFDQDLRTAFNINVRATRDLILQAREMKQLKSFIHVSTAYSNCARAEVIEEKIYAPPMTAEQLEAFLTTFPDDEFVKTMEQSILQGVPNTYTFTKCAAEELVDRMAKEGPHPLPVSIVRPSIILSTYKEPITGWTNNLHGPIGVTAATMVGLNHTLHCAPEKMADIVPCDYVVSALLAVAYNTAHKGRTLHDEKTVEVYNYSAWNNAIAWKTYMAYNYKYSDDVRPMNTIWVPFLYLNRYLFVHNICWFLMHTIPAHLVDTLSKMIGKSPRLVEGYKKMAILQNAVSYFICNEWQMPHRKILKLFDGLNEKDRELFEFRMSALDWCEYFGVFMSGARIYVLKDPLSNLPAARKRYQKILYASYALKALGVLFLCLLVNWLMSSFTRAL